MAITITQLTSEQLTKSEVLEKIRTKAREYIIHEQMSDAWFLANKIEARVQELMDSSPEIYKQYQKIIVQLKLIAIPFLTDSQVFELLEKYFLIILKQGLDIKRRISVYLASKSVFNRDQFKRDILIHLKKNQEEIGSKTLGEWLLNYDKAAGARKNTSLERTRFITRDLEANKLSEEAKQYLLYLLEFYDNLKISVPLPIIGVSEVTLKEFFREMNIPLPGEKELPLLKKLALEKKVPEKIVAAKNLKPSKPKKTKKPGFFKRLFKKKPKKEKKPELPKPKKVIPESISRTYKEKISPYEKKREMFPAKPIEFEGKTKKIKEKSETLKKISKIPSAAIKKTTIKGKYKIRTMKQDIEKAKKRPIPPKPIPKVRDNIVDLSGK